MMLNKGKPLEKKCYKISHFFLTKKIPKKRINTVIPAIEGVFRVA